MDNQRSDKNPLTNSSKTSILVAKQTQQLSTCTEKAVSRDWGKCPLPQSQSKPTAATNKEWQI